MFIKITTDCGFVGCSNEHLVVVDDDATEEDIAVIIDELVQSDIQPDGGYETLDEEEVESLIDNGLEVEDYTTAVPAEDLDEDDFEEADEEEAKAESVLQKSTPRSIGGEMVRRMIEYAQKGN